MISDGGNRGGSWCIEEGNIIKYTIVDVTVVGWSGRRVVVVVVVVVVLVVGVVFNVNPNVSRRWTIKFPSTGHILMSRTLHHQRERETNLKQHILQHGIAPRGHDASLCGLDGSSRLPRRQLLQICPMVSRRHHSPHKQRRQCSASLCSVNKTHPNAH